MGTGTTRRNALAGIAGAATLSGLAACGGSDSGNLNGDGDGGGDSGDGGGGAATVTVTPEADSADVPVSVEVGFTVEGGTVSTVSLATEAGDAVDGKMHPDGTTWVPDSPLEYETAYVATVVATDDSGAESTATAAFTTMTRPGDETRVGIAEYYIPNEGVRGQAMPIVIEFNDYYEIPEDLRPSVERRLFVESEPAQVGTWHWFTGSHLEYRPKEYWEPGTEIKVRLGLGGLPLGNDKFGQYDIEAAFGIDTERRLLDVDNDTKELVAYRDDDAVNTTPVSLGSTKYPSYYGHMVIMSRETDATFVSDLYEGEVDVDFAMRMTFSGQYLHSAPWSVADQGVRNVSHGCVNVSLEMGEWLYEFVKVGDPIVVKNTEVPLQPGDGFTAWDLEWEDFVAGSALPPPE